MNPVSEKKSNNHMEMKPQAKQIHEVSKFYIVLFGREQCNQA